VVRREGVPVIGADLGDKSPALEHPKIRGHGTWPGDLHLAEKGAMGARQHGDQLRR
jgi:hypothetical protein